VVNYVVAIIWFLWFIGVAFFDVELSKFMTAFILLMLAFSSIVVESLKSDQKNKIRRK